jgi:uncharacterized protein (TIGR02145 family)
MKHNFLLQQIQRYRRLLVFFVISPIFLLNVFSQAPSGLNFQTIVRDDDGVLMVSQNVDFRIGIWRTDPVMGTNVYTETHTVTTSQFGVANLSIGEGTPVSGNFSTIDWSNGPYYVSIEMDAGGGSYLAAGSSQLLSVPYALYANSIDDLDGSETKLSAGTLISINGSGTSGSPYVIASTVDGSETIVTAGTAIEIEGTGITGDPYEISLPETDPVFGASVASGITSADIVNWNNKQDQLIAGSRITISGNEISAVGIANEFHVGKDTLGGIVFYAYPDGDGHLRGFLVSKTQTTDAWQNPSSSVGANRQEDGAYNTDLMVNSPAKNWIESNYGIGWYLPSIDEFLLLWANRFPVNKTLRAGGHDLLLYNGNYWTSRESSSSAANYIQFQTASVTSTGTKTNSTSYLVRAIRPFETVADIEGNQYLTVTIGTQTWMASNLRTTTYNDGTPIEYPGADDTEWSNNTTGAYAWMNHDESAYSQPHGAIYNWHAVNNPAGLCPTGWHVPTHAEWTTFELYLIANGYNYDGSSYSLGDRTLYNYVGKSVADTSTWNYSAGTGNIGNTDYPEYRNKSGFSATGAGIRLAAGGFSGLGTITHFWAGDEVNESAAYLRRLANTSVGFSAALISAAKSNGWSVRCIKD